jgi:glycosyltransferase involved in cell wall biosynthesis
MRLLHVTHQYRPAIGGAEQYITALSEELAARGHEVTVYTSRSLDYRSWRSELVPAEDLAGVRVRRFRSLVRGPRAWRWLEYGLRHYWPNRARRYEPLIYLGNGPVCPGLFRAVSRHAREFDLVHLNHLHYAHSVTAYAAIRRQDVPIVVTPHLHIEQPVTYDVGYMRAILRGSEHILADSPAEREFLLSEGLDRERVTTVGIGICPEQFEGHGRMASRSELGLPAGAFVVLFLGRKTEYKGLDAALSAYAALQERYPHLHLLAVGPETEYSQSLWGRYDGLLRLHRMGAVADEVRLAALSASDCLVMPSTGEAFGIVYLEAWAAGIPVIGARTRAVSGIIADGRDGYLVSPDEPDQVADRLARWIENPALAREMGECGRQKVDSRYTVSHIADMVEGVYLRTLRRYGSRDGLDGRIHGRAST